MKKFLFVKFKKKKVLIPLNLDGDWKRKAQELRNKLLMFRFRSFGRQQIDPALIDRSIEPRLAQLFGPLLSVIETPKDVPDSISKPVLGTGTARAAAPAE